MDLLPRSRFDLHCLATASDITPLSEIKLDGQPSGVTVAGATLEAAIGCNGLFLVFVSDDVPSEETLRIYLFDQHMALLDAATLGAMYATGAFSGLTIIEPRTVLFRFFGGEAWSLTLRPDGVLTMPWISEPKGSRRPFGLRRRFLLSSAPWPETAA